MFVCLYLYLYRKIYLTTEPVSIALKVKLLIGPEKIFNYFGEGNFQPTEKNIELHPRVVMDVVILVYYHNQPRYQDLMLAAREGGREGTLG